MQTNPNFLNPNLLILDGARPFIFQTMNYVK